MINIILALAVAIGYARAQSQGCMTKADITFLLDSSDTVGKENFQKQLGFVKDFTNNMDIGSNKSQISAVTFSSGVYNQFYLNQYATKADINTAVDGIQFKGGRTHTADAIKFATDTSFNPLHGGRAQVPHVAILITNGASGSRDVVKLEAQRAKDNGVTLYTIGVGGSADMDELRDIASDPDSRRVFTAENYDALHSLASLISTKVCNELPNDPTRLPTPTGCLHKADLVFLVDSSSSVGNTNFQKVEHFLKDVVTKLDVGHDRVHVGLMTYSSYPSLDFPLDMYQSRAEVMKAIEAQTYMGGGTNTADAIKYMNAQMFSQNSGARGNVPRIAVVITNGASANPGATVTEADKARMNNIGFYAIGVGSNVAATELNNIADQPSSDHVFTVNSYDNLDSITNQLINRMCTVKATVPSLTTSRPGGTLPPDPCSDKLSNCASYGQQVCRDYKTWANDNCKRTCNFCTPLYTVAPPTCKDKLSNCASYGQDACSTPGTWAQDNCKLSCGFCGPDTNSVGFYGKCSFKGKTYNHGEKWYDGCDYECICEDGSSGRYKCNNRCPVYYNLPLDCTLVSKPGQCCQEPVCNFHPQVNVYTASGKGTNPHGISVCEYKNKQYLQGQSWRDGCDFQCTCVDSNKGEYKCEDLCPVYHSIPPACHLEQQAGECCKKPVCEYDQQTGSFTGYGSISGQGVGSTPTQAPPCVDAQKNCHEYGISVCTAYRSWSLDNCKKYCNMCPSGEPQPSADDKCIYNGKMYTQGESWNVKCDTMCTCENSIYGYYRCVNTCPQYNNIPSGCYEQKKAGDCCPTIQCDTGYFFSSSNNIGTIGNGGMLNVSNPPSGMTYVSPTLPSGEKPIPGSGGTGFQAPSLSGCLYKGQLYVQNQAWEDGCEYSCYCKDAISGLYSCRRKCPTYPDLPASCHLEVDPNDPCCRAPVCSIDPVTHKIPVPLPVFQPSTQVYGVVQPPYKVDTSNTFYTNQVTLVQPGFTPAPPTLPPGAGSGTGGIGFCTYNGVQYKQGELWEDGCEFNCICEDASNGFYRCIEKCVHYGNLPTPACFLIDDPLNPCCKIPKCIFVNNFITHIGHVTTTPKPRGEYCVYEGTEYRQGQSWYDGCSYKCTCENAAQNVYRCMSRCPEYLDVQPGCHTIPDPRDPSCCVIPQCAVTGTFNNFTNTGLVFTNNGQVIQVTPAPPGSFTGQGTGSVGYCEFKGIQYGQGQKWEDSCDYECTCTDAITGFYRCIEKCKRYINLPAGCELITDFANPCCKTPQCNFMPAPGTFSGTGGTLAPTSGPTKAPTPLPPGQTLAPGLITPAPHYNKCVYKGAQYLQGQTWSDGCSYNCRCDDADRGLYVCNQRCSEYKAVPQGCTMVVDPRDSCCLVPQCAVNPPPTIAPNISPHLTPYPGYTTLAPKPYPIPTAAPGQFIGSINYPTPLPGQTPSPVKYCEYKGVQYNKGQRWDDGCDYVCECIDDTKGQYRCTEKCPRYVNLPPNCRLSKDPANPCCHMPECDWPVPSPNPNIPTPHPPSPGSIYTPIPTPGPVVFTPTPSPTLPPDVCVYKGQGYSQGQTWYDGCLYICSCENGKEGIYRCNNRCPRYQSLPSECYLIPDPNDPLCCQKPKCDLTPTLNNTSGYVNIPTAPPGIITGGYATPIPSSNPNPNPYLSPTPFPGGPTPSPIPGVSTQKPPIGPNLSPTPNPPNQQITPVYKDVCVYKGQQYTQGQKWSDGCDYDCQCLDAKTGQYQCKEKCPLYMDLPPECRLVRDYLNPCCQKPYCETIHITPTPRPTQSPTFGPTLSPNPMNPFPIPGSTRSPTPNVCVYNGVQFKQGASWNDGCDLVCSCEDASTGFYRCNDRCPKYDAPNCQMMTDPRDACCRVPFCTTPQPPTISPPLAPNSHPTLSPPFFSTLVPNPMNSVNTPYATPYPGYTGSTPKPVHVPTFAPTPNPFPTPTAIIGSVGGTGVNPNPAIKGCMYHGVMYRQGQQWQDGCSYNCECINEDIGRYKCLERCPLYLSIPSYCRMIVDPKDSCCKSPECIIPTPTPAPVQTPNMLPTASPLPNHSTVSPPINPTLVPNPQNTPVPPTPAPRDVCVYKGQTYVQGQTWFDGCDSKCVCEDGKTGFYRCNDRCAKYRTIPNNCYQVADPNDPMCCQVPQCIPIPGQNGVPTPLPSSAPVVVTGVPGGSIIGTGMAPTPTPGPDGSTPVPRDACIYGGVMYHQDQKWQDGCKYNCTCIEGMTGKYRCDEICPTYPFVPPQCHMKRNPDNLCCYIPVCDFNQKVPTPAPPVTPNAGPTPGPFGVTPIPGTGPTPSPGATLIPPTLQPPTTQSPIPSFCVYNGVPFRLGQTWTEGCSKKCRCDNADQNIYTCFDRCPTYTNIAASCQMVADSNDPCCQIPQCTYVPTQAPTQSPPLVPGASPTPFPNGSYPLPNPVSTMRPTPFPNGSYPSPIPGHNINPTPFPNGSYPSPIPGFMSPTPGVGVSTQVPPYGLTNAPTPMPVPSPIPTAPTGVIYGNPQLPPGTSRIGYCEYKGVQYKQGQKWDDGCSYNCECMDENSGQYRCMEKCPRYAQIPSYCTMVQDPNDKCCKTPYCPGLTPTLSPTQSPNYSPGLSPTPAPVGVSTQQPPHGFTVAPQPTQSPQPKEVCIYNGRMYTQGQRFFDGCDKVCVCDNGMTGAYTCTDRCPTYNLSPNCVMVPDPNDPICCKAPKCDQTNTTVITGVTGSVIGYGTTPAPVMQPTAVPPFGPGISTPKPNQVPALTPTPGPGVSYPSPGPGVSYPSPGTGVTLVPQPVTQGPTPAPRQVCIYKGRQYTQGQRWQDGCLYNCECIDGMTGQYRCTDRCPRYPNLPSSCRLVSDTLNPCCQKVTCDNGVPTLAPPVGVTLIPGAIPPQGVSKPTPQPGMSPTPGPIPVNPTPFATPSLDFCVYQGVPFRQGQTFTQGCDKTCKCEDAVNGKITCTERCPTYQALQPGCTLTTDQNDPCCQVPTCINIHTTNPDQVVTGVVGTVTGTNLPDPGNPYPAGTNNACVYNGNMYRQGQTWEDGCKYNCVCEDSSTGFYRCTEKCPRYAQIPSTCTMMEDPNNKCCEKPFCIPSVPQPQPTPFPNPNPFATPIPGGPQPGTQSPTLSPNLSPLPGVSTPKPATLSPDQQPTAAPNPNTPSPIATPKPRAVCTYNGDVYQQGQLWYDGCNAICRCENASTNFYRCQQRCGDYPNLPTACYLIPDPKDPTCCERPECPLPTPMGIVMPTPGFIDVTGSPLAVVTGIGKVPTMAPTPNPYPTPQPGVSTLHPPTLGPGMTPSPYPPSGPVPSPMPKTGCMYKGMVFKQGQKWDDGCDYECECIDEHTGQYRCVEKCPRYSSIPQQCILLQDPKNPCCQKPYCDYINPTPFPTGYPTPQPNLIPTPRPGVMTAAPYLIPFLSPTPAPNAGPSPRPGSPTPAPNAGPYATPPPGFCVYSGVYYTQGQTWDDGCKLKCKCEDVSRGFYTCLQRCPTYSNLPSSCVLRTDQNDPCCIVPDCNNIPTPMPPTPTPAPPGVSTQKPPTLPPGGTYPTPVPSMIIPTAISGSFTGVGTGNTNNLVPYNPSSSNAGFSSACVYKGTAYNQNQKWDDGCQYKCECLDASRGMYRCTERCPKYYYLPPQCYYEKDPSDACCQVAKCNPYATPVPQLPYTLIPGSGTGPAGTNPPYNPATGPGVSGSHQPYTAYPGSGTGPTGTNPPYNPVTGPGVSGSHQPYTAYPGSGTGPTGTNPPYNPATGPGISGSVQPFTIQPNPGTGVSGTGQTITVQPPTMCVYSDGTQHAKGSRWQVACKYDCVCDDPAANRFHCTGRCQAYSGLPSFCNLIDDPADSCCKTPQCILPSGATLTPIQGYGPSGTVPPGSLQVLPVGTHTVITGSNRPIGPNTGTGPVVGQRNVCVYKGSVYQQGQSWDDGCDYVCTCDDAVSGLYSCISKCPQYPPLPAYCKSANVPGLCCPSISCDIPGYGSYNPMPQLIPTPAPSAGPGGVTPLPPNIQIIGSGYQTSSGGGSYPGGGYYLPNATSTAVTGGLYGKCVYKQRLYNQGEDWNDGCDFHCECKDGTTGYYECRPFCPTYNNLPSNQCYLVKADGQCCSQPMCYDPTTGQVVNPLTSSSVFPVVGSYVGGFSGFRPGYNFVPSTFGNSRRACVYKGQIYNQGDSWEDGCDYSCQCLDAATGQYMCRAKCPTYTKIPPLCQLLDQPGSCCKQIQCQSSSSMLPDFSRPTIPPQGSTTTITGLCMDKLDNCNVYGQDACKGVYESWARRNCPAFCNFCQNTFTTTPVACVDKLNNCHEFGKTACTGIYAPWAYDNCRQFCGLCPQTGQLTTPAPTAACADVDPNCASLGTFFCTGAYQQWASENCKQTCGLCGSGAVTTPIPTETATMPVSGWLIFLKGVAGAPGPDLFQLWNGNETLNVNVPGANTFTAQYNGHYKPDYSNHWNDYCIDKVKVSIYNHGVEKANIIFDATGTDKMGWFSPDRILSSTWTDIKSAPKEIFSMLGDPSRGREFYASGHSTGCDAYGWIMISTKDTCFFEMGDKKPTFYYAPGQTQAHWQTNNPLTGDVFVIQAHPTCSTGQGTGGNNTQSTSYCDYKGKKYAQDATWDDGCDFTCTCVDASIGYQRCRPKCPQYTGLPDGCRIEKQPGQCCGSLNCNPGISTPGTINVTINPFSTCNYKGMYYNQGETWDDGCEFKCTCADASRGYYTCGAKCLTWKLPPACHLDPPAPGKCCKVPSCPTGYVINYPAGYKEE